MTIVRGGGDLMGDLQGEILNLRNVTLSFVLVIKTVFQPFSLSFNPANDGLNPAVLIRIPISG